MEEHLRATRGEHAKVRNRAVATGQLRPGLDVDEIADVIWATNATEFYLLLVGDRGWTPERFEAWLAASWIRLLLD